MYLVCDNCSAILDSPFCSKTEHSEAPDSVIGIVCLSWESWVRIRVHCNERQTVNSLTRLGEYQCTGHIDDLVVLDVRQESLE